MNMNININCFPHLPKVPKYYSEIQSNFPPQTVTTMKSQPRKNTHGRPANGSTDTQDSNLPIFFFLPNDPPYGTFCQWEPTTFTIPRETLTWLRTAHPGHREASPVPPAPSSSGPIPTEISFNCAEQFMMFCKALYFHDKTFGNLIMSTDDPSLQKKYGRAVKDFIDFLWRQSCERVAFEGNWWKFSRDEARRNLLLGTGDRMICEASSMDRRWGIGYKRQDALRYRGNWGENLLGKGIMQVRSKLRERVRDIETGRRGPEDWDLPGAEMWVVKEGVTTAR
ncbi:hypothetical protein BKA65DRAFT_513053 [Rhexocercosporidium sp. MPI-PUGE-AT-0058]|nr:hypothetical protein BKA65DRAFT_513053 [Rhexocercosporidium sp. MPI-PUGE-AT-0058]